MPVGNWCTSVNLHVPPSFARVIALTYLDLHVRAEICVSAKESLVAEAWQMIHLG